MRRLGWLALVLWLPTCGDLAAETTWRVDSSNSSVGFEVTHLVISRVGGVFDHFAGSARSDGDRIEGTRIEAVVDVASLDTGHAGRDEHLLGEDFFAVDSYPEMRFVGVASERVGEDEYRVEGKLTLRGVTRPLSLEAHYRGEVRAFGKRRRAFRLEGSLDRFEYGLQWNGLLETGEAMVSRRVDLRIEVELTPEETKQP